MKNITILLPKNYTPTPQDVILHVCKVFNFTPEAITGKSRAQPLAFARQLAMVLVYHHCHTSLCQTAKLFDRHHSSVVYARSVITETAKDKRIARVISDLMSAIDNTWESNQ